MKKLHFEALAEIQKKYTLARWISTHHPFYYVELTIFEAV